MLYHHSHQIRYRCWYYINNGNFLFSAAQGMIFSKNGGLFPNISGHKRNVGPDLLRAWRENPGLSKTAIVIRVETINYYFPYRNPPKAEMLLWALGKFSFITVGQKGQKGQNELVSFLLIWSRSLYKYWIFCIECSIILIMSFGGNCHASYLNERK